MRLLSIYGSLLILAAALLMASEPARASEVAYEGFGQSFPIYANGGDGFSGPWVVGGFNAFAAGYTSNVMSLSYPSLDPGTGGSVSGAAFSAINGALRPLAQSLGADNTTVYLSFLLRPDGILNNGIFSGFFGVTLNGSLSRDLFIGKPGGGAVDQYVLETRGGSGQVASGASANMNHTALMVLKAQFLSGNDTFTLYTNPKTDGPQPVEPSSGAAKSDLDLGSVSRIGIYSSGAFTVDEIRIGTSYDDVVVKH